MAVTKKSSAEIVQKKSTGKVTTKRVTSIPSGSLEIINHMRCHWVVPAELIAGQTKSDVPTTIMRHNYFRQQQKVIRPNSTVLVDKAAFDKYYKGCRAFQAMLELNHLKVSRKPMPEPMLKSIAPTPPPPDLTAQSAVAVHVDGAHGSLMEKMPKTPAINK